MLFSLNSVLATTGRTGSCLPRRLSSLCFSLHQFCTSVYVATSGMIVTSTMMHLPTVLSQWVKVCNRVYTCVMEVGLDSSCPDIGHRFPLPLQ